MQFSKILIDLPFKQNACHSYFFFPHISPIALQRKH